MSKLNETTADGVTISGLPSMPAGTTATDDVLPIVDTSAKRTKKITLGELSLAVVERFGVGQASFTWDVSTSSPAAAPGGVAAPVVTSIHKRMRACVLNADGTVNYYLNPANWAFKEDGTPSDLSGKDGNVMIEVPKFWFQFDFDGSLMTWRISSTDASGFTLHPAFFKDGQEVDFRYYGAYDACVYKDSNNNYVSGLNWDDNAGTEGVGIDINTDKLASVKGIYPMVGLTRAEFRSLASNVGSGWRQLDFDLWSAVQVLYLIEYQTFFSQKVLGDGNTNGSYVSSSGSQDDSPHTIAGAGDSIADGSTDAVTGVGVDAKPGTSFMKYRGIENLYGNAYNWADGINVNVNSEGNVYVTNDSVYFVDDTSDGMKLVSTSLPTSGGYISQLQSASPYFLSASNSGGSSTTYVTDEHYAKPDSNRVVLVGGNAFNGAAAGAFCLGSAYASSLRFRYFGARLAF